MRALLEAGLNNAAWAIVLALLAAAGARLWRRRPAIGHTLWLLVLFKLVTPSLVVFALFPAGQRVGDERPAPVLAESGDPAPGGAGFESVRASAATVDLPNEAQAGSVSSPSRESAQELKRPRTDTRPHVAPSFNRWRITAEAAARAIAVVWLGGAVVFWFLLAVKILHFRRLIRAGSPVPLALTERIKCMAQRLGVSEAPVALMLPARVSPMVTVPLFGRPHLALPEELWASLEPAGQEAILAHELAHLRRRDHWVRRLEAVVCGLYWWYPVAWWARREIERAEEECCDHWVVWALPAAAAAYAQALVATAAFLSEERRVLPVGASGVGRLRDLKGRLEMILSEPANVRLQRYTMPGVWIIGALLLLILPGMISQRRSVSAAAQALPFATEQGSPNQEASAATKTTQEPAPKADAKATAKKKTYAPTPFDRPASTESDLEPVPPSSPFGLQVKSGSIKVRVEHPVVREVTDSEQYDGHIAAARDATIRPRVSGAIMQVIARPGEVFLKGDLLFKIDPRWYTAELDKAQAELDAGAERLSRAKQEYEHTKRLVNEKVVVSAHELELFATKMREAQAALRGLQSARDVAKLNLDATDVRAPFSGTVSRPVVGIGNVVIADTTPLAKIAATDTVSVLFNVSQQTLIRLNQLRAKIRGKGQPWFGYPVGVGLPGVDGFPHEAKINSVDFRIDPATGNATWGAELANPDGMFLPGMSIFVRLKIGGPHREMLVPETAVFWEKQPSVFVLTEKNTVVKRPVAAFGSYEMMRAVRGLKTDEWVVVSVYDDHFLGGEVPGSQIQVTEGMKVVPEMVPAPADAPAGAERPQ